MMRSPWPMISLALFVAVLAAPLPAAAADGAGGAKKKERTRIAVTDFVVRADDASKGMEGLGLVVAAHLESRTGAEVITPADVAAMLDLEGRRQILGCDEAAANCLAEIGGALGANYVLSGQIARIGSKWVVSLSLIDVEGGGIAGRATKTANNEDEVLSAAEVASDELAAVIMPGGGITQIAPTPKGGGFLHTASMIGGGALAIGGLALMGTGYATYADSGAADSRSITMKQADGANLRWGTGLGLAAGGVALLAASFLMQKKTSGTDFVLAPTPNGVVFVAEVW